MDLNFSLSSKGVSSVRAGTIYSPARSPCCPHLPTIKLCTVGSSTAVGVSPQSCGISSVEVLLGQHVNQRFSNRTAQRQGSCLTGLLSDKAPVQLLLCGSSRTTKQRNLIPQLCESVLGNVNSGLRCVGKRVSQQERRVGKDVMIFDLYNELQNKFHLFIIYYNIYYYIVIYLYLLIFVIKYLLLLFLY